MLAFPGNRMARLAGLGLVSIGVWHLACALVVALCPRRERPPINTLPGAFLAAFWLLLSSGAAVLALALFVRGAENSWDTTALLRHVWLLFVWMALFRLALHPLLLGRFLERRSTSRGVRFFGACLSVFCIGAAILAVVPYLLSLDRLGYTVLRTVLVTFVVVIVAVVGSRLVQWAWRRHGSERWSWRAGERLAQTTLVVVALIPVAWMWWRLLDGVLLSPNAPLPVQETTHLAARALNAVLRLWRYQIDGGMTVSSLVRGVGVFALSFWVSKAVRQVFHQRVLSRTPMDDTTRHTFAAVLGYLVIALGFLVGLNVAGSSLANLALLAGAITVGLGFGLQNVINNFVSSLLIHFGRTIRVGDFIEAAGTKGTVREIGFRNTVIVTADGVTVLVPNGSFVSANIVNWTNPTRRVRLHVPLSVPRQAPLGELTQILSDVALAHPRIVRTPPPAVEIRTVTGAQIAVELLVWTETPEAVTETVGQLALAADQKLRDKGLIV